MTATLAHILRHPVKSVGREELREVTLAAGRALPYDRVWAVAHEAAELDAEAWAPKRNFLRGVAAPPLMAIRSVFDEATDALTLAQPAAGEITVRPEDPEEARRLVDWLRPLWPENRPAPSRLVKAGPQPFTDMPDPLVSILNLSSNRALGQRMGRDMSIHRWRGNLWIDGLAPWEEADLVGRTMRIGEAALKVEMQITRCRATEANPETGRADADTLGALEEATGGPQFGLYARVTEGGRIAVGDPVRLT